MPRSSALEGSGHSSGKPLARSLARLAAVQALYQMDVAGSGVEAVLRQADAGFPDGVAADPALRPESGIDAGYFEMVVRGVQQHQSDIDRALSDCLAAGWRLGRLDATLRAILRAGGYELLYCPALPVKVALSEYVVLAQAFFSGSETGFVNAALDALAHRQDGAVKETKA